MKHNWIFHGCGGSDPETGESTTEVYQCSFCDREFIIDDRSTTLPSDACDSAVDLSSEGIKLWLDDERRAPFGWVHCNRVEDAKVLLHAGLVAYASLDHDLGFTDDEDPLKQVECETGYDLCMFMAEHNIWPKYKPLVHSANPIGAERMRGVIDRYGPYGSDEKENL